MTEEIALNISRKRINYFVNGTRIFTRGKYQMSISHHLENIKSRCSKDINIKIFKLLEENIRGINIQEEIFMTSVLKRST